MAPGPSSSPLPHTDRLESNNGEASTSASGRASSSLAVPGSQRIVDSKSCHACGCALEWASDDDVLAPHRTLNVGSHTFILSPNAGSERGDGGFDRAGNAMRVTEVFRDEQGQPICQACHAAQATTRTASTSASAPRGTLAEDAPLPTSPSGLDTSMPLSITIGDGSSEADLASLQPAAAVDAASDLLVRRQSFTRSRTTSPRRTAGDSHLNLLNPVVSFPLRGVGIESSSNLSTESPRDPEPLPAANPVAIRAGDMDVDVDVSTVGVADGHGNGNGDGDGDDDDERYGPSRMTRPRLSTLAPSAHRSQSPSASRILNHPLRAPFAHKSAVSPDDDKLAASGSSSSHPPFPHVDWYQPHRPDPTRDVTHIRQPPRGRGCLYPGAKFQGYQKSGRLSYDVTVEILNVDMPNSHLDGYLNIRGLTEDWPEMTTYFEAEIIGQEHRFTTGKWGASQADDVKHWSRFMPFELQETFKKEGPRFNHLNKPFVFMRWKERFLVPDWRVRDIHGASFAGFYYVCVEFGDMDEWNAEYNDEDDEEMRRGGEQDQPESGEAMEARMMGVTSSAAIPGPRSSQLYESASTAAPTRTHSPARTHLSHRRLLSAASMAAAMNNRSQTAAQTSPSPSSPLAADNGGPEGAGASLNRTHTPVSERRLASGSPILRSSSTAPQQPERERERTATTEPFYHHPSGPTEMQYRLFRRNLGPSRRGSSANDLTANGSSSAGDVAVPMEDVVGDDVDDANRALLRELRRREEQDGRAMEMVMAMDGEGRGIPNAAEEEAPCPTRLPDDAAYVTPATASGNVSSTPRGRPRDTRPSGATSSRPSSASPFAPSTSSDHLGASRPSRGRITAFYWHSNSEPFQRLDLTHVPQRSSASFEMR